MGFLKRPVSRSSATAARTKFTGFAVSLIPAIVSLAAPPLGGPNDASPTSTKRRCHLRQKRS
jgi:hypothetical protein